MRRFDNIIARFCVAGSVAVTVVALMAPTASAAVTNRVGW